MAKYHYNIEKKETKTNPGVINLTKVKKTETVDGGRKPPKVSLRDLFIQFMNKQEEFNKQVLNRLDNVDKRLDNVDKRLDSVEDVLQRNNLK
jgi:hypothetical protein